MINTFCIAHKKIVIPLTDEIKIIWLCEKFYEENYNVNTSTKNIYFISDISDDFDSWHNFLGGSSGAFAAEKIINESINLDKGWHYTDKISIIQYRKFISPVPMGAPSNVYPGMYIIHPDKINNINICNLQREVKNDFLLSQPVNIGGTYANYSACHYPSDLLRYLAIAIELNIISKQDSIEFITFPILIPGGIEFGIYPIPVFIEVIGKLRLVCMEFLKNHRPVSMKPEQRRALAFCNERLGSYLLFKHLQEKYLGVLPADIFGYMHTVSCNDYA